MLKLVGKTIGGTKTTFNYLRRENPMFVVENSKHQLSQIEIEIHTNKNTPQCIALPDMMPKEDIVLLQHSLHRVTNHLYVNLPHPTPTPPLPQGTGEHPGKRLRNNTRARAVKFSLHTQLSSTVVKGT